MKKYLKMGMLLTLLCLTCCSCSGPRTEPEAYMTEIPSVEVVDVTDTVVEEAETKSEGSSENKIDLDQEIAEIFERGESKLFWEVSEKGFDAMDQYYAVFNLRCLNRLEVETLFLSHIFEDWDLLNESDSEGEKQFIYKKKDTGEVMLTLDESGGAAIHYGESCNQGSQEEILKSIVNELEKVSGVSLHETEYVLEDDDPYVRKYLYYPDGVLYDMDGRGDYGEDIWTAGSGIAVEENGDITINSIPVFSNRTKKDVLSEHLSIEEIRLACELAWEDRDYPAAAVAEQASLIYMVGKEGSDIVPVWRIQGYFYAHNQNVKHVMNMMIDALSGQIIRFS